MASINEITVIGLGKGVGVMDGGRGIEGALNKLMAGVGGKVIVLKWTSKVGVGNGVDVGIFNC